MSTQNSRALLRAAAIIGMLALACTLGCSMESRVETLVKELSCSSTARKIWVIQTLGALKSPLAVEALEKCLEDTDPSVRKGAVWALGQIGNSRATEVLIGCLKHRDPCVRKEAAWILSGKVTYPGAYEALKSLLETEGGSKPK
jgi:hypothetical protein